jgi:hypothetical protein
MRIAVLAPLEVLTDDLAPTDTRGWLRVACTASGRDMTRAEWRRYLPGSPWEPTCSDVDQ